MCLSNALYLYLIILHKYNREGICDLVFKSLVHTSYEVILTVLNYLLILHRNLEAENKFQQHIYDITGYNDVLLVLRKDSRYIKLICNILKHEYLECKQKCLRILVLENDTQKYITDGVGGDGIVRKLVEKIYGEHENLTHVYVDSLSMFIREGLGELSVDAILEVMRVVFECSTPDNGDSLRGAVVSFLEKNISGLMSLDLDKFDEEGSCKYLFSKIIKKFLVL